MMMNDVVRAIYEGIASMPFEMLLLLSIPILVAVPLNLCRALCTGYGGRRQRVHEKVTVESVTNDAPIPCDIHNDCTDCAFNGTGYCWKVMKHE